MSSPEIKALRNRLAEALAKERLEEAVTLTERLERLDRDHAARWAQRRGDLYRRMGRLREAALAFEQSAQAYAQSDLRSYAEAMERTSRSTWPPPSAM